MSADRHVDAVRGSDQGRHRIAVCRVAVVRAVMGDDHDDVGLLLQLGFVMEIGLLKACKVDAFPVGGNVPVGDVRIAETQDGYAYAVVVLDDVRLIALPSRPVLAVRVVGRGVQIVRHAHRHAAFALGVRARQIVELTVEDAQAIVELVVAYDEHVIADAAQRLHGRIVHILLVERVVVGQRRALNEVAAVHKQYVVVLLARRVDIGRHMRQAAVVLTALCKARGVVGRIDLTMHVAGGQQADLYVGGRLNGELLVDMDQPAQDVRRVVGLDHIVARHIAVDVLDVGLVLELDRHAQYAGGVGCGDACINVGVAQQVACGQMPFACGAGIRLVIRRDRAHVLDVLADQRRNGCVLVAKVSGSRPAAIVAGQTRRFIEAESAADAVAVQRDADGPAVGQQILAVVGGHHQTVSLGAGQIHGVVHAVEGVHAVDAAVERDRARGGIVVVHIRDRVHPAPQLLAAHVNGYQQVVGVTVQAGYVEQGDGVAVARHEGDVVGGLGVAEHRRRDGYRSTLDALGVKALPACPDLRLMDQIHQMRLPGDHVVVGLVGRFGHSRASSYQGCSFACRTVSTSPSPMGSAEVVMA